MTSIMIDSFDGEYPKVDPRLIPDNAAQFALNCDLRSGKLVPDYEPSHIADVPADTKTIYGRRSNDWISEWGEGFTTDWISWDKQTYFFESPFAREQKRRIYTLQYENDDNYLPLQYEGTGIPLQDVVFEGPTDSIIATYIDRNDPNANAETITSRGSKVEATEEAVSTTITTVFDSIICVGSANPSNNIVNGNSVTFDYTITNYYSTDNGVTFTADGVTNATYTGSVLYAGGENLFVNPAIPVSYTKAGATDVKVGISAAGNDIVMGATGGSLAPSGEILDRYYSYTYVYTEGEESPPSELSNLARIYKGDVAELSSIGTVVTPTGVVKKRLYCTSGGLMKVLGEIEPAETTFTDDVGTAKLFGEQLVANNPEDMHGVIMSPLGFAIGWNRRDILLANPYLPYAWDDGYTLTTAHPIMGMVAVNDIVYVLTEGTPYILSGFTIDSMSLEEIPEPQSCLSRTGITRYKGSAFYVSPDGIVELKGGSSRLFTRNFFNRETWDALHPESSALVVHDDVLHLTTDREHYKFALAEKTQLTRGSIRGSALYHSIRRDGLFYVEGDSIMEYLGDTNNKTPLIWKSREYDYKTPLAMMVMKVEADGYDDVEVTVEADGGAFSYTVSVLNSEILRVPARSKYSTWSISVMSTSTINSLQLAQSAVELK